jgi:hypothetical protein
LLHPTPLNGWVHRCGQTISNISFSRLKPLHLIVVCAAHLAGDARNESDLSAWCFRCHPPLQLQMLRTNLWPHAALAGVLAALGAWTLLGKKKKALHNIPIVEPRIPVLGNALAYAKDPPRFLRETSQRLGPVFELDLAGLLCVAVCSTEAARQVEYASESVLSSRAPIEAFGFLEGLGTLSTHSGAAAHKFVLKNFFYPLMEQQSTVSAFVG